MESDPWAQIREMAGPERPALIAVADVSVDRVPWPILPAGEHHWIRLRPRMMKEEIGTLVASSAVDGVSEGEPAEAIFRANVEDDYAILLGGVYSIGLDDTVIHPGCCIGLEDWRQWVGAEASGDAPYFGHGPPEAWMNIGPKVIRIEQGTWTWGEDPEVRQRIIFTRDEYRQATVRLEADIDAFAMQVLNWATDLSPSVGPLWAEWWLGNLDMLPGSVRPPRFPP